METRTTDTCFIFCPWKHFQHNFWPLTFVVLRAELASSMRVELSFLLILFSCSLSQDCRVRTGYVTQTKGTDCTTVLYISMCSTFSQPCHTKPSAPTRNHVLCIFYTYECLWKQERSMPASRFALRSISSITFGLLLFFWVG